MFLIGITSFTFKHRFHIAPVTAKLKIFFQLLCKSGVSWDQVIIDKLLECWKEVITGFSIAGLVTIDRCYLTTESNIIRYSLRGFCDASSKAYAAIIYLLIETDCGGSIKFVAAKSRVAPLSTQTIPRLELLLCLLLVRLTSTVSLVLEPKN